MKALSSLKLVHDILINHVKDGDVCIDATLGRGYDTAFLCSLTPNGKVIGFDIQEEAVSSSEKLLKDNGFSNAELHLDSHANIGKYAKEESVSAIVFNLGYLPKGDHSVFTRAESTIPAITSGLKLLKSGGLMVVSVYYGGDSGYEERDALMPFLKTIDSSKYQVLRVDFFNWTKDPPIPVFIRKL